MEDIFKYLGYIVVILALYDFITKPKREKIGLVIILLLLGISFVLGAWLFSSQKTETIIKERIIAIEPKRELKIDIISNNILNKILESITLKKIEELCNENCTNIYWQKEEIPFDLNYKVGIWAISHEIKIQNSKFRILERIETSEYATHDYASSFSISDKHLELLPLGIDIGKYRYEIHNVIEELYFPKYDTIRVLSYERFSKLDLIYSEDDKLLKIDYDYDEP